LVHTGKRLAAVSKLSPDFQNASPKKAVPR
jgi:hypothetical protein